MALIQAVHDIDGHSFLLTLDAEADSIEIVFPGVFDPDEGEIPASYYAEVIAPQPWGPIMVRYNELTDAPIGLMLEHASRRTQRSIWVRGKRAAASQLELIERFMELAHDAFHQASGFGAEPFPQPEFRHEGGWLVGRA